MSTSSINFEAAYSSAELIQAAQVLREWLEGHPHLSFFTFDQLCAELGSKVPADQLNRVLAYLVAAEQLKVKYRAKIHEGEYSEDEIDTVENAPSTAFDSAFSPHDVDSRDWVPAYAPSR